MSYYAPGAAAYHSIGYGQASTIPTWAQAPPEVILQEARQRFAEEFGHAPPPRTPVEEVVYNQLIAEATTRRVAGQTPMEWRQLEATVTQRRLAPQGPPPNGRPLLIVGGLLGAIAALSALAA